MRFAGVAVIPYPDEMQQSVALIAADHGAKVLLAGEVTGGIHGHNRLGSNSLQDIFVFGRRAGRHAAEKSRQVKIGKLSLQHLESYNKILKNEQLATDKVSPLILPEYRFEKALTKYNILNNDSGIR